MKDRRIHKIFTQRVLDNNKKCITFYKVIALMFFGFCLNNFSYAQSCACTEMIYMNEVNDGGAVHKYSINSTDGTLTEVGNAWYPGSGTSQMSSPHGLGTDLNGKLYIAETSGGDIRRLDCDGNISPTSEFEIDIGGFNISSIGNTLYTNGNFYQDDPIRAYDLCTGAQLGSVCLDGVSNNGSSPSWGFYIDPRTEKMYATDYTGGVWIFDESYVGNGTSNCVPMAFDIATGNPQIMGITTDENENIYIVTKSLPSKVQKFSQTGTLLATSPLDNDQTDGAGFGKAAGIVYSETSQMLYVSSESPTEDCLTMFDKSLTMVQAVVGPSGTSGNAKGVNIMKECCPTNNNLTIDTILCDAAVNDVIFLQELINCSGTICEGLWQEDGSNTGITYNSCNNSITIDDLGACGSFTLESDGVGNNLQCGVFTITVNIEVGEITASVIAGDQTVCPTDDPAAFTLSAPANGSGTINYQWQRSTTSCTAGFSDIAGATSDTYDSDAISQTTYFRVLLSVAGGCNNASCQDTSNCVVLTIDPGCPTCINPMTTAFAIQPSCTNGTPNNDGYLQLSSVTDGDRVAFSTGSTFTGDADYANAATIGTLPFQFNTGLSNPSGSQDYTIRVFNGISGCFTDMVVTMNEQDCMLGCDCMEYLYLNDTDLGEVHKFSVSATDGTITEIGNPWMSGFDDPHGLGVDINGNFYIGDRSRGPIYKVNCDGGTVATDATLWSTAIEWDLYNISSYDGYIITNGGGPGLGNKITVFDPCDGSVVGSFCLEGLTNDWGLQVLPDGTILATDGGFSSANKSIYQFQFDTTLFNGTCIDPFVAPTDVLTLNEPLTINGTTYNSTVTLDDFGSLYGVTSDGDHLYVLANATSFGTSYILKINATTGALVDVIDETVATNGTYGWAGALGLVYAPSSGLLYVSGKEDCLSILDPSDLSYVAAGAGAVGPDSNPKAVALVTECCPTNNNITVDTTLCNASLNDRILLQELVNCGGTICEGMWEEALGNTGLTYNNCDNSITISSLGACGTFTLESDGIGNNPQCGAFKITVKIEVEDISDNVISSDQSICPGDAATVLTSNATSSSGTLMYQWQKSTMDCTTGYSDIAGATSSTYDPGILTDTTYFRLLTSVNGSCATGTCTDTSNCVSVMIIALPTTTVVATDPTCTGSTENDDGTITLSDFTTEKYDMTTGSAYTGSATYATATAIPAGGVITNTLANPSTSQDYTVRIFNSDDCFVDKTVTINEADCCTDPILTALTNESICVGDNFTTSNVTTSVTNGIPVTYQWYNDGGVNNPTTTAISGQTSASLTTLPTAAGSYSYRVEAANTSDSNCAASETVTLIVYPPVLVLTPSLTVACTNSVDTITVDVSGGSGVYTHAWTDLNTGTASGYTLDFLNSQKMTIDANDATPGTIDLQYIVEDSNGCMDTITSHTVTIPEPNEAVVCRDKPSFAEIVAESGLTNVVWYNSADIQVATGDTLLVDITTLGMEDGMDSYYYTGSDLSGCEAGLCCPVMVASEDCCKPNICVPFTATIQRGNRN